MPEKKVRVPVDTFVVFLRFPKDVTKSFVAKIIRSMAGRKDEKIFFLPNCVEVIVVNNKGQTKVL